ncbi:MAG TPA: hypothetical protein VFE98_04700 [Candidatus Bathyarchaeia archaeon]|nr:hypothetical protein [Candidatus Bathyarchaeia archaeon]
MSGYGHVRRAFEDLRPYLWPIIVLLTISLLAVPIALIVPLPIKLLVDSVLGSQPLPGYLTILVGPQASKTLALSLAISILLGNRGPDLPTELGECLVQQQGRKPYDA